ncbi:hypothetical protein PpBr36_02911 [Pyricularia pennisetigena]|uniref:hypothetical protein n=1 Tax=Pyricularia pennisetigena TaxID=1578925 RepID=UPI0011505044|nr:hypothetical protein PpBr36_02911 [Pyricularia pennisetigena]TLS31369.1 hypothetical protein PpBr36_02911 [Pyricularia pennisetigena]
MDSNARLAGARKLWRAWRTIHQMLSDRGYELSEEECNISIERFLADFTDGNGNVDQSKLSFSARPSDAMLKLHARIPTPTDPDPAPDCGSIWVEFINEEKIGVGRTKQFVEQLLQSGNRDGILVTQGALSSGARRALSATGSGDNKVEAFMLEDLLVNITHHELVPKHVMLSRVEKKALLERYRLKETQLPRIQTKDPVARYLGLQRGNVVKIIRHSETAGRYASYRLTV